MISCVDPNELFLFIRAAKPGSILIDSSTVDPSVSQEIAAAASAKNLTFLDAPVSGGKFF